LRGGGVFCSSCSSDRELLFFPRGTVPRYCGGGICCDKGHYGRRQYPGIGL
jgi:hypothetical protein